MNQTAGLSPGRAPFAPLLHHLNRQPEDGHRIAKGQPWVILEGSQLRRVVKPGWFAMALVDSWIEVYQHGVVIRPPAQAGDLDGNGVPTGPLAGEWSDGSRHTKDALGEIISVCYSINGKELAMIL